MTLDNFADYPTSKEKNISESRGNGRKNMTLSTQNHCVHFKRGKRYMLNDKEKEG